MYKRLLALSLSLMAFPAMAGDINYNYFEVGYQKIDFDEDIVPGVSIDGDGFGIGGSFEIGESWFVAASYGQADFDFGVDFDTFSAGVGWHTTMSNSSDFYAKLEYVRAEASVSGFSIDDDGFGATIGLRGMVTDAVEIGGSIGYVDFDDGGDGTTFGAHALYSFTENVAAGLLLDFDEDTTSYGLGIRFYW